MGNCCRTPKPRRTATQSLSVETDVLTISLKPLSYVISKAAVSPLPDPDLTSLSSGNNTARSHRRGRSDPEADEDCTPVDYFSGEDSRESLILTPLADPAPKLPPHPLVPPLNFTYLQPEKTTLNVDQVQAKRNKWSKERQRGRLLLEISKSPEPENPPNLSSISSSKESIPRPKNLLPMAQNSVRAIRSMETTPKPKPRICLPKIPLVMPILHTRRTEDLAMSALTGTTLDEKSDVKNVEYLHEVVRVIHRDIKPDNVLLDKEGNIKVSDFGSSQTMRNPDDTFTNTPGTPAFLSPEQCGGTKEFLGKPLDIWAMGVTLYYMLYNRPPFIARRLGDLYESIKSEEVNLPHECSKELKDLILRLLEKNPIRRIQLQEVKDHPWLRSRQINQSYA